MPALYTVGQLLPSGAHVATDTYVVGPDGSTVETMVDTLTNKTILFVPGAGTTSANLITIQANLTSQLTSIETWITNNPSGAAFTNGQSLFIAQSLAGLIRVALGLLSTVGGS
jgi:hypothetical protein